MTTEPKLSMKMLKEMIDRQDERIASLEAELRTLVDSQKILTQVLMELVARQEG